MHMHEALQVHVPYHPVPICSEYLRKLQDKADKDHGALFIARLFPNGTWLPLLVSQCHAEAATMHFHSKGALSVRSLCAMHR